MAYQVKRNWNTCSNTCKNVLETVNGELKSGIIKTTVGKLIFNESIPQDLGFVDRE